MDKIDIYQKIQPFIDEEFSEYPAAVRKMINYFMKFLLKINRINQFINIHNDKTGLEFIDEIFDYLDFSYNISDKDRRRIPSEGKLLIASNHPLGALDGLALLKSITEIRKDVKILANDVILNIEQISEFMIPVNIFKSNKKRDSLLHIEKAMTEEQALIIFPAGEVSRLGINGIKDGRWQKSIVKLSVKYNAPILPVYINARNSYLFYLVSMLIKKYSFLLLPREMFKKSGVSIKIKIGDMIPASAFAKNTLDLSQSAKILRKHIYSLRNGKHGYFSTEKTVIHPVDSRLIKKELISNESLGQTSNGKHIFMCDYDSSMNVMKEVSRLRELTFRKVGEGTGKKNDVDKFDKYYRHLVLWDNENLDIIGSYRIGICNEIIQNKGTNSLYNSELFLFHDNFIDYLNQSIELGRSFIQQKYWKSNALDYLWQGIGRLLISYPHIRFLFGAVSLSNSYPEFAKALIISYYKKWYFKPGLAYAKNKFIISNKLEEEIQAILQGDNYHEDFKYMKNYLKNMNLSVPVLYRQYTELCDYGGAQFLDFGIDTAFSNSIDGLIVLDLQKLNKIKRDRYYNFTGLETVRN